MLHFPLRASLLSDIVPYMPRSFLCCYHRSQEIPQHTQIHSARRNSDSGSRSWLWFQLWDTEAPSQGLSRECCCLPLSVPGWGNPTPGAGMASNPRQSCRPWLPDGHRGIDFSCARWLRVQNPSQDTGEQISARGHHQLCTRAQGWCSLTHPWGYSFSISLTPLEGLLMANSDPWRPLL